MDTSIIWQNCLTLIKNRVAAQTFETWFAPLRAASLEDSQLTLQVPSQFYYEWLDSHYRSLILDAIKQTTGKELQIKYSVVIGDAAKEQPRPALSTENDAKNGIPKHSQLNDRYTFDNFVEGSGNQFAKAAALSVCDRPQKNRFNPLVIYGGVGLGKTHLLQAVGNFVLSKEARTKVVYVTSEKFTLDFITAIQKNRTTAFSRYYRNVDMLLVDDIQFFQKKEQTQEQFFHTFNDLYQRGKQIVMTLDRPPSELSGLQDRLISRFQSGLIVDIHPPDLETRIAILMRKADEDGLDIPYEVTEYIAHCIKANVRDLEGALIRLLAHSSLRKQEITLEMARQVVQEILGKHAARTVSVDEVIKSISHEFDIRETTLVSKGRRQDIALARQVAMYLSRELTGASLVNIGLHFAGRDHSTVIHACRTIEKKMDNDPVFRARVDTIQKELANVVY
ncbi:MAG: chromosomal replication initiator protein DnaA [Fidelibacterota bacterium]|nr:MAG: chromosomal replication initiator protein DnaA [Candidatus Neomarinimicrobiota bacterium]